MADSKTTAVLHLPLLLLFLLPYKDRRMSGARLCKLAPWNHETMHACSSDSSRQLLYSPVNGAAFAETTATCRKLIGRVADPAESTTEGLIHGPVHEWFTASWCLAVFVNMYSLSPLLLKASCHLKMLGFQCFVEIVTNEGRYSFLASQADSSRCCAQNLHLSRIQMDKFNQDYHLVFWVENSKHIHFYYFALCYS